MTISEKSRFQRDREERQKIMRRRILKAAMKLFLKKGYANVTIRKIAAEIEYSPAAIYRYFTDKDEIFFALRGEGFELFYQTQMAAGQSADPGVRMRKHAQAYVDFAFKNPEYYDVMFLMRAPVERAAERDEWADTVKSLDLLRKDIALAMAAGIIRKDNIDKVAFPLWSSLHGLMALILRGRLSRHTSMSEQELARQAIDFMLENILIKSDKPKTGRGRRKGRL